MRQALAGAEHVVSSRLTLAECARVLVQAMARDRLGEAQVAQLRGRLAAAHLRWDLVALDEPVLERVERSSPIEPIRTLDAIHLASALEARAAIPGIALLSLDERIRRCGARLGFDVLPEAIS